ncbi:hypothetical protein [Butyrivibrio sp. AE3004]|uniref:hypothetical protein n=1 Tax=Butyrivibrio sp. AE3004 TaxID=1506994 RepID=UPI0006914583|nr:hypothetical protein [Butyrivibrio sp. AE3004]
MKNTLLQKAREYEERYSKQISDMQRPLFHLTPKVGWLNDPNGFSWEYDRKIMVNHDRYGKIWECPDLFSLDGKEVLIFSVQEMLPEGLEFHNGFGSIVAIGDFSFDNGGILQGGDTFN